MYTGFVDSCIHCLLVSVLPLPVSVLPLLEYVLPLLVYVLPLPVVPKTAAYRRWNCQVIRPAHCCHLIPSNRFLDGFQYPSQFAAAKLTHYSTIPHRPSDSSPLRQASCSQVMFTSILAMLPSIHVPCVQATSQVVGELYVQSLFWLGSFEVFWSSKRSGVPSN